MTSIGTSLLRGERFPCTPHSKTLCPWLVHCYTRSSPKNSIDYLERPSFYCGIFFTIVSRKYVGTFLANFLIWLNKSICRGVFLFPLNFHLRRERYIWWSFSSWALQPRPCRESRNGYLSAGVAIGPKNKTPKQMYFKTIAKWVLWRPIKMRVFYQNESCLSCLHCPLSCEGRRE